MVTVKNVNQIRLLFIFWLIFTFFEKLTAFGESPASIDATDAAPVLSKIESTDIMYASGSGSVLITNTLIVSDVDSKTLRSATVQITSGFKGSEDVLKFTDQFRIVGSWDKATGILTLKGSSSVVNYESALRSIRYENTNTVNPSTSTRTISFRVNDGISNSNIVSRNIILVLANQAPVLSNIESDPIVFCMNSGPVQVTSSIAVNDPDDKNLASAKIQISSGYTTGDELSFSNQNGISGSWDNTSGILTLSGDAPVSAYQDALRSIRYAYTNTSKPATGDHRVTINVSDGKNSSNVLTRSITINGPVTAILSGTSNICNDNFTKATLTIDMTGTPPWNFTLLRDNGNEVNYNNITKSHFTFDVGQEGKYTIKSISDASCTGDTAGSGYARITYIPSPTAFISGADTVCPGDTAKLQIALTGLPPWNFTFARNGAEQTPVDNVQASPFILRVTNTGIYTLKSISDANCRGTVSGTATVSQFQSPTAVISGTETICEHTAAHVKIDFTGTAPWTFRYKLNNDPPVVVSNVLLDPDDLPVYVAGTYTLTEVNDKNCKGTVSGSATIKVNPAPVVTISGLAPAYAKEDNQLVLLTGSPAGGTFSGPGLFFSDPDWYFLPGYAPVGRLYIVYSYQSTVNSCIGYDSAAVRVLEAEAAIDFPESRTNYCQNESPFTISAVNLANAIGEFTISGGTGLTDNHNNTATIDPSLLDVKEYTLTYTYFDAMDLSITTNFDIRNPPVADFHWESECFSPGQEVKFDNTSTSSFGSITGSSWKIQTDAGFDTASTHDFVYTFTQPGNHTIDLQVQTSYGCTEKVEKIFGLKPLLQLAGTNYFEDFNSSPQSWQSGKVMVHSANSWKLDDPSTDFPGATQGNFCWFTHIPLPSSPIEESWVTSPCFDFRGTKRPILKMDIWRQFDSNRDGANLQVTTDSGKTWTLLGQIADGVQWFNHYDISGNPGGSIIGWSSNTSGAGNDSHWTEARHSLDILKDKSAVQFRINYGSDGTAQDNKGFAFDNFWIGERNRITLLEHFTNASSNPGKDADLAVNKLVDSDSMNIVDLQYHTSFPGADPFNAQESDVPGIRVLYYGLSDVPFSVLNGGAVISHMFDYDLRQLDTNLVHIESLLESKFMINLISSIDQNSIRTQTQIIAKQDMPATELTVHVAIIERIIRGVTGNNGETVFENVVKTLLPDAAGTTLYRPWNINDNTTIYGSWNFQNVYDPAELRAVAFIQDETTREVYQVALDTAGIVTGVPYYPGRFTGNRFIVFPNPASDLVVVRFETPADHDMTIEMYDELGSLISTRRISKGEDEIRIPTVGCPDGIYIIRAISVNGVEGIKKLTITR